MPLLQSIGKKRPLIIALEALSILTLIFIPSYASAQTYFSYDGTNVPDLSASGDGTCVVGITDTSVQPEPILDGKNFPFTGTGLVQYGTYSPCSGGAVNFASEFGLADGS